jgi:hypothetical protein
MVDVILYRLKLAEEGIYQQKWLMNTISLFTSELVLLILLGRICGNVSARSKRITFEPIGFPLNVL